MVIILICVHCNVHSIHSNAVIYMKIRLITLRYVYYLSGRSDITDRTHLIMLVIQDVLIFLARATLAG